MVYKTSIMNETPRQHSFKTCTRVFNMTCLSNPRDCVQALEVSVDFQINSERSPWAEDIYNSLKLFQIMHVSFRQHMCTLWPQTMEPLRFQTLGGGLGLPSNRDRPSWIHSRQLALCIRMNHAMAFLIWHVEQTVVRAKKCNNDSAWERRLHIRVLQNPSRRMISGRLVVLSVQHFPCRTPNKSDRWLVHD